MRSKRLTTLFALLCLLAACACGWCATATQVAAGYYHTLAVKNDATLWTCGANWRGQIGDATTNDCLTPIQAPGMTGVIAMAGGNSHTVAAMGSGTAWAWGGNWYGQLGDGTTQNDRWDPVQVSGLDGAVAVTLEADTSPPTVNSYRTPAVALPIAQRAAAFPEPPRERQRNSR